MIRDFKLSYALALLVIAIGLGMQSVGLISGPIHNLSDRFGNAGGAANASLLFGHFFFLALFSAPSRREIAWIFGAGAVTAPLFLLSVPDAWDKVPLHLWFLTAVPGFGIASLATITLRLRDPRRNPAATLTLIAACGLVPLLSAAADSSIDLTRALHPATLDLILYKFDWSLGFSASSVFGMVLQAWAPLEFLAKFAYVFLPYGISMLFAAQIARGTTAPANAVLVQVVSAAAAWLLFQFFPAAGPRYAFGDLYPYFMPSTQDVPAVWLSVLPAPRNAMPSMHFGWAIALWLNSLFLEDRWLRAFFAVLVGLNVMATLGLGEHYLIDLVVAAPVIVAVQAVCMRAVPWSDPVRKRALLAGAGMALAWLGALRYGIHAFVEVPGLSWIAVLATIAASAMVYRPLHRAARSASAGGSLVLERIRLPRVTDGWRIAGLFVLSGCAGLVYQVLFSKALALTFGSTATATYTVLATYMGGMALGAWVGGVLGARQANPLVLYAVCELGIGLYCLFTPWLFPFIRDLYVLLAAGQAPDSSLLLLARFVLGIAGLLPPTVLMGMTLPVLARHFEQRHEALGTSVAWLYGANTLGAALGALAAGYLIMPSIGMTGATMTAVGINLFAAYFGLRLSKTVAAPGQDTRAGGWPGAANHAADRRLSLLALTILGVGGVVSLALEIDFVHLLAIVAGNSVYAFSLMLFAFLLGLGAGAEVARRLLRRGYSIALTLAALELGLAVTIVAGIGMWDSLPQYFASFAAYALKPGFAAREAIRAMVCLIAMFPSAFFIGAIYPVAMEAVGRAARGSAVLALGRAAALNTAGNIVGVVVGGFLLLPVLGVLMSLKLLASLCIALAGAAMAAGGLRRGAALASLAAVSALVLVSPRSFDLTALASGSNVYFAPQSFGAVVDHAESIDGGLTTVAEARNGSSSTVTLLTNGKFQGNDAFQGEVKAQVGFSMAPLLHVHARRRALVVGYGTGMSARVLHDAGFGHLDIIELSEDIVRLANRHFARLNGLVSEQPGVSTYITDGRNFLMLGHEHYDLIAMEITSIWFSGAASLYNRDFYELVRDRLAPGGVMQQWIQLHHMTPLDMVYVLGSVRNVFRYVWLYYLGSQGVIVASNDPASALTAPNVRAVDATAALRQYVDLYGGSAGSLLKAEMLDPAGMDACLAARGVPLQQLASTDDNLILEYSTPKGNALDTGRSLEENLQFLRSCSGPGTAMAARH